MPPSVSEIRGRITSVELDILRQSLEFARRCLERENERGKAAETRATVMLGALGVVISLVLPLASKVTPRNGPDEENWFLFVSFLSCLAFLLRALFYAVRIIGISKRYRVEPTIIYDLQALSPTDGLKEEIAAVMWEYHQTIQPNTDKLFWLHRCQRNSFVSLILLVFFGMGLIAVDRKWFEWWQCASFVVGILAPTLFMGLDYVMERKGSIWGKS